MTTCTHAYTANGGTFYCTKPQGHDYGHLTYINGLKTGWSQAPKYADWFKAEYKTGVLGQFNRPGVLEFTTHELAELYVILSGNHDIPEVYLNKIGAALKEML